MQNEQQRVSLIEQLLDNQPNSVVWLKPVFENKQGEEQVIDFIAGYCNKAATQILGAPASQIIGSSLTSTLLMDKESKEQIYQQCLQVWQSNQPVEFTYYSQGFNRYFHVQRSRVADGILSVTRDRTEEITTEQKRQLLEQKYQRIIDTAADGVLLLEAIRNEEDQITDFRIVHCNKKGFEIGRLSHEAIGHTLLEVFPHLKTSPQFLLHVQVMETGKPEKFETTFRTGNGEEYGWFMVSLTKLGEEIVSRFVDITERKRNEQQIELQRNMLNSIFEASMSAVFACEAVRDEEGKIIDLTLQKINAAFTQIIGKTAEEVEGRSFTALFPGTNKAGIFQSYCRVIETGQSLQTEIYYKEGNIDGWFSISAVPMGSNSLTVSFTDVTQSKMFKQELEKAAQYLQQVIDVSPTGIFTMVPSLNEQGEIVDFRFKTVNRTFAAYVKQQPEELIGQLHEKWLPLYKSNGVFDIYKQVMKTGEEIRFDRHFKEAQIDAWLDITVRKVEGDLLVSFHDFTDIKQLQLQLENAVQELQRSNQSLEEFAYAASHDLQEPLRKIHFFSERLKTSLTTNGPEENSKMLERITTATNRMQNLIEDLLSYSRMNVQTKEFKPVDLNMLIQQVLQDLETAILETDAIVQHDNLPTLLGDERQMKQLFQNLIGNAIKYRKPDTRPEVSVTCSLISSSDPLLLQLPEKENKSYYRIEVKDNGIGFEQEHAQKIFQAFHRLHGRSEYPGTGVGLAIAQKVVANHKGLITAEGVPGKGAIFTVLLPS